MTDPQDLPKTPTEQLRQAISDSGMSQYELAKLAKVPQPRLNVFMSGQGIRSDTFDKLATFMGMRLTKPTRKPRKQEDPDE